MARVEVRVTPRAGRTAILGFDAQGRLQVRLAAAPVDGKANEALLSLLAQTLRVPRRSVTLARGERGRIKVVQVEGMNDDALRNLLENMKP